MAATALPLADWHDFYLALATAAATFAGLLFVSVSINVEHLRSAAGAETVRVAARAFGVLVLLIFMALFLLIPALDGTALAVMLGAAGLQGAVRVARAARRLWTQQPVRAVIVPGVAYLGLVGDGVLAERGSPHALPLLVVPVLLLLTAAAGMAWSLLLLLRARESAESPGPAAQTLK